MDTFENGDFAYQNNEFDKAFRIFQKLAESGDVKAQISLAGMYFSGQGTDSNLVEASKWYRFAAEQGYAIAQINLATILFESNPKESIKLLKLASSQDMPLAQSMLGDIYSGIYGLSSDFEKDYRLSKKYYEKAGEKGFSYAYHRLGEIYLDLKKYKQAFKYFEKASKEGYAPSQLILSQAYQKGLLGLEIDPKKSEYWLNKSRF
ncbi:tetratricopeptide repeat protein [Synechococcus sp. PCC 7336]|uniref:tetratricopeptide repeat protein n=1 Tax=Synechococcus sp. PCC 7336 TaxID=195250 RepID=UPI000348EB77|nr:tetratricopeptide repeat protein [Synechococcus sp. PCC 7336]